MSVPLQSVPDNQDETTDSSESDAVTHAEHEAAEIVDRARRQAEAIVAEARQNSGGGAPNPLAALGDNADEIIGQVRKLISKQRELQTERENLVTEIASLKEERDELVQRLTDAVERMEELAALADQAQGRPAMSPAPAMSAAPPPPPPQARRPEPSPHPAPPAEEDTSLAARLRQAEREERGHQPDSDDSSLAARLERAEREREERARSDSDSSGEGDDDRLAEREEMGTVVVGADGRSFYDRHSAKLPRLQGDGGRSVLSAIGDMRPESEPKGRKGRRRNKK